MAIGFIGTGRIAAAMVEGLCGAGGAGERIVVSPRGAAVARDLATRFSEVEIADGNQGVIDTCETVFLCLRPEDAMKALAGLAFRPDQRVISTIGTMGLAEISRRIGPATRLYRAGPLPTAARRAGPVAYHPADPEVEDLLARFGVPVAVAGDVEFSALWCVVGLIATFYGQMDEASGWAARKGVAPERAETFTASLFAAVAGNAIEGRAGRFADLADRAATPGGLNAQALRAFRADGGMEVLRDVLESLHARLTARTTED
ncbi:MAG: NAD(P)-binding domain-containing protein [Proteobacteria bacterium]|nr:NAD(P)-binding domain-containing protein [Pseudomonadota bacterium]